MTIMEWLRARVTASVIDTPVGDKQESLEALRRKAWSELFEQLMRNRLLVGRFRYGAWDAKVGRQYDNVGSAIRRLRLYQATGNLEHLVDAANLAMVEFEFSNHPKRHFQSGDDGEHADRRGS